VFFDALWLALDTVIRHGDVHNPDRFAARLAKVA
jgi:hypothetical protein